MQDKKETFTAAGQSNGKRAIEAIVTSNKKPKTNESVQMKTLTAVQQALAVYYQAYVGNKHSQTLIDAIQFYKVYFQGPEFVVLFLPYQNIDLNALFKIIPDPAQDPFFQWVLNEVESCISQFPEFSNRLPLNKVIKALCCDTAHIEATFARSPIKEVIQSHYAKEVAYDFLVPSNSTVSPLAFLQRYFPDSMTRFKTECLAERGKNNFLDLIVPHGAKYILQLWDEGFRPYNQRRFNLKLFGEHCSSKREMHSLYSQIAADARYHQMLNFAPEKAPVHIFLDHKFIDSDLFVKLVSAAGEAFTLDKLLREKELPVLSDKLLQFFSLCPSDSFSRSCAQPPLNYPNNPFSQPHNDLANSLWIRLLRKSTYSRDRQIIPKLTRLFNVLHDKGINKSDLLKTTCFELFDSFALAFQVNNPWGWNPGCIPELLFTLFCGLPNHELVEIISPFICAAVDKIAQETPILEKEGYERFSKKRVITVCFVAILMRHLQKPELIENQQLLGSLGALVAMLLYTFDTGKGFIHMLRVGDALNECISLGLPDDHSWFSGVISAYLATVSNSIIISPATIDAYTKRVPNWLSRLHLVFNEKPYNILSVLLKRFEIESEVGEQCATSIIHILKLMAGIRHVSVPTAFLKELADLKFNPQRRAGLSDILRTQLEAIFNQCIYTVRGQADQIIFEDMCNVLFIQYEEGSQTPHIRENHARANEITQQWFDALGGESEEKQQKMDDALTRLLNCIELFKGKRLDELTQNMNKETAVSIIRDFFMHDRTPRSFLVNEMTFYGTTKQFILNNMQLAKLPIVESLGSHEKQQIYNARLLIRTLSLIMYYAEHPAPEGYNIFDAAEVIQILVSELKGKESSSAAQGIHVRLLMALEPIAQFTFPYWTHSSLHFFVKTYINKYFKDLTAEDQLKLIQKLYDKVAGKEEAVAIDSIPDGAFLFLYPSFFALYKDRLGFVTEQDIQALFQHPGSLHPKIVEALDAYHQEQLNNMNVLVSLNRNSFFGSSSRDDLGDFLNSDCFVLGGNV